MRNFALNSNELNGHGRETHLSGVTWIKPTVLTPKWTE